MKVLQNETKQNFNISYKCIGKVVDNIDLEDRGRLKCTIEGIIDSKTPTKDLPWCETQGLLFAGNNTTTGISSVPEIGTYVYIEFLYHNPSFPIVTGYIRGNADSSFLHTVKNLSTTIYQTRTTNLIGPELVPLNNTSTYPNNNVIETKIGVIEIDDTTGNERISIQHKNGSHFEIRPDGTVQIKSIKDFYSIIKANVQEYIEGAVTRIIKSTLNESINTGRTINTTSTTHMGDLLVTGDIIASGIVKASDCISGSISGKSHTHPGDSGGITGLPL